MTNPVPIDRTHGGETAPGVIDCSVSINPLGPPPGALDAYQAALTRITSYPPPKNGTLEKRLATWFGVEPRNVLAGNGTTQLIYLLSRVLEPARPFVVVPTFSEIANALAGEGLPPEPIPLARERQYRLDLGQIDEALTGHAGAIFLGHPNSPTGTMVTMAEVGEIASRCERRGCWCVLDEAFIDFVDPPDSAVQMATQNPRVIVLRSLTKSFAIPGLRLGCVVAAEEVVDALRDAIEPWSVNVVAESVGLACLEQADEYLARTRALIARERAYLADGLANATGVQVFPAAANFLLLEVEGETSPGKFGAYMLSRGIAVRDLRTMPGCKVGLYRIGVRDRPENERLVKEASRWRK